MMPFSAIAKHRPTKFASPLSLTLTLLTFAILLPIVWYSLRWLVADAPLPLSGAAACTDRDGACWPFVTEKLELILFGTYPRELVWRPITTSLLLIALTVQTGLWITGGGIRIRPLHMAVIWPVALIACFVLMGGGIFNLAAVDSVRWNGLPILLILSIAAIAAAFPLGVLLALARTQEHHGLLRRFAAAYVEIARGVPMLTVLFVGVFVLPLMLPAGVRISPVTATLVALVLFHAAYFAEDVRAGLSALPQGQSDAARALGLSYPKMAALVLLPQALRRALPSIINSVIGAYKDTSLVVVLGIHDLTATAKMAFSDPLWRDYALEAYFVIGLWFFISCAFLSMVGRRLQRLDPAG